jgi:hypothetical protein
MKKFIDMLPVIEQDKANHLIYGLIIFMISMLFLPPILSFTIVIIIAFLKEVVDTYIKGYLRRREFVLDFLYTILGAGLGWICLYL